MYVLHLLVFFFPSTLCLAYNTGQEEPECGGYFNDMENVTMDGQEGAINLDHRKWKKEDGIVMVPYQMRDTVLEEDKIVLKQAMDYISSLSCIRFKERENEELFFGINRYRYRGRSSHVSRQYIWSQGGRKFDISINLQIGTPLSSYRLRRHITHELFHVLGVTHTQKRKDRDDWITIMENIPDPDTAHQYSKCETCDDLKTPYDCMSIMHYRKDEYMSAKNEANCDLKSRNEYVTWSDMDLINLRYDCPVDRQPFFVSGKGTVTSHPDYPAPIPSQYVDGKVLQVKAGNRLRLKWNTFKCSRGLIRIVDGNGDILLQSNCRKEILPDVISKTNRIRIEFKNYNYKEVYGGYSLQWEELGDTTTPTITSGVYQSPNFPGLYNRNDRINKKITVADGSRIKISFTDFDIAETCYTFSDGDHWCFCRNYYISIKDGNGKSLLKSACGKNKPSDIKSETNSINITFNTNGGDLRTGFRLTWEEIPA